MCTRYLDWLGEKLGYDTKEKWYKVSMNDFMNNFGEPLLKIYNNSPGSVVMDVYLFTLVSFHLNIFDYIRYSSHPWLPWKFSMSKKSILNDELLPLFVRDLANQLHIHNIIICFSFTLILEHALIVKHIWTVGTPSREVSYQIV